jgi:antirestriction protein
MADTPRVWIACLAAYNEGHLHGEWVDATDVDEMNEAGARIIKTSPALLPEELAIHDYDGFGNLPSTLGEYPSFETVARIGALIEEHGDAFIAYLDAIEVDVNDEDQVSENAFWEHWRGEWDSEKAYAYDYVENCGWGGVAQVPDELENYLDWDAIVRDLFQHGTYVSRQAPNFNVFVFETEV